MTLKRTLSLYHVVLFGLAYMTPMIVFGTYGVLADITNGVVPTSYLIALIAMLFTAYSYGKMVQAYPTSGSAYTYTRKTVNSSLGFLVGWAVLLDYLFLPMVIWLIGGVYLNASFPSVPTWVWIVGFIAITTIINLIGLKVATNINFILMVFQILVIAIFLILSVVSVLGGNGAGTLLTMDAFMNQSSSFSLLVAGAAIACYSFLGFDAVTTLSEETIEPKKTIPKAIFLIALFGGAIFIISAYFLYLVHPDYSSFVNSDSAAFEIAKNIGGNMFGAVFLAGLVIAQFTSGLSAQTSAARLLFAMGRDSVLPRKIFGYISKKHRTPVFNLCLIGIVGLLAVLLDVTTSTSFINFGAFITFMFVNISVVAHYYIRNKRRSGSDIILYFIFPLIGFVLDAFLFSKLDIHALVLGSVWTAIGFAYLLFLTKGFKEQPPEIDMSSVDEPSNIDIQLEMNKNSNVNEPYVKK